MRDHQLPFGTLGLPTPHPDCRLIITIPAKDEANFISCCLDALYVQQMPDGKPLPKESYAVIVLANNCQDDTAGVCEQYALAHPDFQLQVVSRTLPPAIASVGTARRWMMDTAFVHFRALGRMDGVICTTDADTLAHPEWAYHILKSVELGAEAVGGRILVSTGDRAADLRYRKNHLQDVTYRSLLFCLESMIDPNTADPWPRHFQHFGPSTAVTAAAYQACGGLPPLTSLEDVGLARALERAGITVTHNRHVKVYTSSRVSNRVDGRAFSQQLDEWADMKVNSLRQQVVGLENSRRLFKWKVALRHAKLRGIPKNCHNLRQLAEFLAWPYQKLVARILDAPNFGSLYQDIRETLEAKEGFADTDIDLAIRGLRHFTSSLRHRSFSREFKVGSR